MEGAQCSPTLRVSSGVASPEAEKLPVALSPPGGIYPRTRLNQGCGVPALLAHRDLPRWLLPRQLPGGREGGRGPFGLHPSPDLACRGHTDRPTDRQKDAATLARRRVGRVAGIPRVEAASGRGGWRKGRRPTRPAAVTRESLSPRLGPPRGIGSRQGEGTRCVLRGPGPSLSSLLIAARPSLVHNRRSIHA